MKKNKLVFLLLSLLLVNLAFAGPSIVGSMNSWNPADSTYNLTENTNGVWVLTKTLAPGDYAYKVVEGDSWGDPNWPVNQAIILDEETDITWSANLDDDFVTHTNPVIVGDFISEVGGNDWDPADLTGEMTDMNGDDVYEWQVLVPEGEWQFKVTFNHNWDQNTVPGGGNYTLSANGVDQIKFTYDMSNNNTQAISLGAPEVSSVVQYLSDIVDVNFNTTMDTTGGANAANNISNYQINERIAISTIDVISAQKMRLTLDSDLTPATDYEVIVGTNVESDEGVAMNSEANADTFTSYVYAPVTFKVDDSVEQSGSVFYVKGSWNHTTGVYDATWDGGAETQMYDDGTHGDESAGDHIFTVLINLVADGGTNTWEWGVNDENHDWVDGNWEFTVVDSSAQTLEYIVPSSTSQDVAVTFRVYMGALDSGSYIGGVSVQGSLSPLDWIPGSNLLSDIDSNELYEGEVVFPAGSEKVVDYKFTRDDGSKAWFWEDGGNRSFTIDDSDSTQVLDVVHWNNDLPEPENMNIYLEENDVHLSWNDVPYIDGYNIYRSTDPYDEFEKINTFIILDTDYTDTGVDSSKYFYEIKAIKD